MAGGPLSDEALAEIHDALPKLASGVTVEMLYDALQRWALRHGEAHLAAERAVKAEREGEPRRARMECLAAVTGELRRALAEADRCGDTFDLAFSLAPPGASLLGYKPIAEEQRLREMVATAEDLERTMKPASLPRRGAPRKVALHAAIDGLAAIYTDATGCRPGKTSSETVKPGPFERFVCAVLEGCAWPRQRSSMRGRLAKTCGRCWRVAPTLPPRLAALALATRYGP